MVNKETKVSINKIKEIIKAEANNIIVLHYPLGEERVDITIKTSVSKDDKARFISDVVNGCFDRDTYQPYYESDLFKIAVLEYFTNIKVDVDEDVIFQLVANTGLYDAIYNKIPRVLNDLSVAVGDLIEYRKHEILSTQKQMLDSTVKTLEQYVDQMALIGEQFKNVDPTEMMAIVKKVAEKDDYTLSQAVLDLRTNTKAT